MRNRKLSHPIKLRDGRTLRTLADVMDVFDSVFANVLRDARWRGTVKPTWSSVP